MSARPRRDGSMVATRAWLGAANEQRRRATANEAAVGLAISIDGALALLQPGMDAGSLRELIVARLEAAE